MNYSFLLETGDHLLKEDGFKLLLDNYFYSDIQKNLQYDILLKKTIDLAYKIISENNKTIGLDFKILDIKDNNINLEFRIKTEKDINKNIQYYTKLVNNIIKLSEYKISDPKDILLSLKYVIYYIFKHSLKIPIEYKIKECRYASFYYQPKNSEYTTIYEAIGRLLKEDGSYFLNEQTENKFLLEKNPTNYSMLYNKLSCNL